MRVRPYTACHGASGCFSVTVWEFVLVVAAGALLSAWVSALITKLPMMPIASEAAALITSAIVMAEMAATRGGMALRLSRSGGCRRAGSSADDASPRDRRHRRRR